MRAVKKRIILLILTAIICSSCNGNADVSSSAHTLPVVTTTTVSEITTISSSDDIVTTSEIITSSVTEIASVTTVSHTSSDTAIQTSSETTAQTTSETSATTELTTSAETTVTTVSSSEKTTTETHTEILTETSIPAAEKPPAVTYVRKVSSPGANTERTDTAFIDYSNASAGYISAAYSGKSAKAKLRIVCDDFTCDHDLSVTGETEYFPLMQGSGDYRIQIYEQLDGKMYTCALDLSVKLAVSDEVMMYLYPNRYSMFDENSDCVKTAAELCAGMDGDIEKIAAIFGYITENITYDYNLAATVQSGYIPDPDKVLKNKTGICFDYASLLAAMTRSQGIPTRLVIGYADPDIYHAWNEVYTEETGWITPELLLSKAGYNLVDATFYAGSENKEAISEYISDSGNYSSVYRY